MFLCVCIDVLRQVSIYFSYVFCLPWLNQYEGVAKVSCSMTQHSAFSESQTSDASIHSVIHYRRAMLSPGLEVIKLKFILKLKIKCNDWLLVDMFCKQPIIVLYFGFETVLHVF